jgi:hypothetical protein
MKDKIRANNERAAAEKRAANEAERAAAEKRAANEAERAAAEKRAANKKYKPSSNFFRPTGLNALAAYGRARKIERSNNEIQNEKMKAKLFLESQHNPGVAGGRRTKRKTHRKHKRTHKRRQ